MKRNPDLGKFDTVTQLYIKVHFHCYLLWFVIQRAMGCICTNTNTLNSTGENQYFIRTDINAFLVFSLFEFSLLFSLMSWCERRLNLCY